MYYVVVIKSLYPCSSCLQSGF